jgi:hypothetical protein
MGSNQMTEYLPNHEDLSAEELAVLATTGQVSSVSNDRLETVSHEAADKLAKLILSDGDTYEMVHAIQSELVEYCRLRFLAMTPLALDGLSAVLNRTVESKKSMSVVKAAETIFDRGAFPKVSRSPHRSSISEDQARIVPSLDSLIEDKESDEILRIVAKQREAISLIDELRHDARMIVDGIHTQRKETTE